jgi:hypothetical protein
MSNEEVFTPEGESAESEPALPDAESEQAAFDLEG